MWSTLAALLLVAYVPGAVLFRGPWGGRERRAALPAEERHFWAVLLSVAWSCAVALLLATLGRYSFSQLLWLNAGASAVAAVVARLDLRLARAPRPGATALIPVAFVLMGLWLYFPPSEYIMGGKDPGTYLNEGIQVAQRGAITVDDPVVASVPPQFRDLFFPWHQQPTYYSLRFMGFFIQDPDRGTVVGQFPHLYPVSIAIGYGLNGLSGARQVVGAWTILGLVATFLLGARLLGRPAATAATALFAVNVVTMWFARYPNAEVVMLALLAAALLATARGLVDGDRFFAPVAGFLLGLLIFLRFDAVLAVAGVVTGLLVARFDDRRIGWGFWLPLVPSLLLGAAYLRGPMRAYLAYPIVFTQNVQWAAPAAAGVIALAAYVTFLRREGLRAHTRRAVPILYAAVLVGLAAYAYFVRQPEGRTALHDAMAFRSFAWYVTVPGLALAVLGLAVTSTRRFWRDPTLFLTLAAYAVFFFYKIRIVPQHFWMTRRFLPVILPTATLMMAGAAFWMFDRSGGWAWLGPKREGRASRSPVRSRWDGAARTGLSFGVLLLLAWTYWGASRPLLHHVEYAGLIPRLEQLAARFGDDDLVLVESRNASDAHVLALPLAYIYARNVLVLNTPRPDKVAFSGFLTWARDRYRRVFFLGGGGTDLLTRRIGVEAVGGDRFQIPEYDSPTNAYPAGVRRKEFDYSISQFVDATPPRGAFTLDVGTNDDLLVVRFHAKEINGTSGLSFRWTRDTSYVSVLGLTPDTRALTIWMGDGGRPASAPAPTVSLALDERPLGEVTVTHEILPYTFALPEEVVARAAAREEPARLRLTTTSWKPRTLLGAADDRELGIVVDRIEAR